MIRQLSGANLSVVKKQKSNGNCTRLSDDRGWVVGMDARLARKGRASGRRCAREFILSELKLRPPKQQRRGRRQMAWLKQAATGGAGGIMCVGRAPRNIEVVEILRCAQNDGAGQCAALGRHYGGLREAKRTHIFAEESLHWNGAGFFVGDAEARRLRAGRRPAPTGWC